VFSWRLAILSIARGDANNDGEITTGDVSRIIDYLFITLTPLFPDRLLGDVNCDGDVTIGDVNLLIDHLFISLDPLPLPCFVYEPQ